MVAAFKRIYGPAEERIDLRFDRGGEFIHISGGPTTPWWTEQYPEQDLWSIPSAVLPSMGSVIPWTPVIQHIEYKYPTANALVYTVKHQLVICRYCRRVAEYEWTETRTRETTGGFELQGGTIDIVFNPVEISVPEAPGSPYDGISEDGALYYYDGDVYTEAEFLDEFGGGADSVTFTPSEEFLFEADGTDWYAGTITIEYAPETRVVPEPGTEDNPQEGFSLDGTLFYEFEDTTFTEAEFGVENDCVATFHPSGSTYTAFAEVTTTITGEYLSHDDTIVTTQDTDAEGATTETETPHGLIAISEANPWGYLTDDLGPRPTTYTVSIVFDVGGFDSTFAADPGVRPVVVNQSYHFETANNIDSSSSGTASATKTTLDDPDAMAPAVVAISGNYMGNVAGFGGVGYAPAGTYDPYGSPNPTPGYTYILGYPDPYAALVAAAASATTAVKAAWDTANFNRWKEIIDFITSEMDTKRFGTGMDVAELRPHLVNQFTDLLVFPVRSRAEFSWADAYGHSGTYDYHTSYQEYSNLASLLGITLTAPTESTPTRSWTYAVQPPYKLVWDVEAKEFTLRTARPQFKSAYFSLGVTTDELSGYRAHPYFGLYGLTDASAEADFLTELGAYTQEIIDAQMESLCLTAAISSLAYPAYSAVFKPKRGATHRLTEHVFTDAGYTATQPAIPNTDIDPLTP